MKTLLALVNAIVAIVMSSISFLFSHYCPNFSLGTTPASFHASLLEEADFFLYLGMSYAVWL